MSLSRSLAMLQRKTQDAPYRRMALSRAKASNCAPLLSIFRATIAPLLFARATPRPE